MTGPRLKSTDFVQATRGYVKKSIATANKELRIFVYDMGLTWVLTR